MNEPLSKDSVASQQRHPVVTGDPEPSLVRSIDRWTLTCLIVNSVIGAGIFGLPNTIAKFVGSLAPLAYILGALISAVIVCLVVELSSQFSEAGGAYLYVRESFGRFLGTQIGWFSFLSRTTTAAAIANLLIVNLSDLFPPLAAPAPRIVSTVLILGSLTMLNILGIRLGGSVSNFFTAIKLISLTTFMALGIWFWNRHASNSVNGHVAGLNGWFDALLAMLFAYSGFESAMIPGGEIRNPRKNVPFSAFCALCIVTVVYLGVHLTAMHALPDLASSSQPLSDAADAYVGGYGKTGFSLAAIVSTTGWLSAAIMTAPRLIFSMAQYGDVPKVLGRIHAKFRTPFISVVLWSGLVLFLALYGNFMWNLLLSVAARLVTYGGMSASVVKLRRSYPRRDAWRVPQLSMFAAIAITVCVALASRLTRQHFIVMAAVSSLAFFNWLVITRRHSITQSP